MGHASEWNNASLFTDDSPQDRAFRAEARDWIAAECPAELRQGASRFSPNDLKPWHRKLYDRGWIAPHWPKNFGGMGATVSQQLILYEEFSRAGAPPPLSHGLNLIGPLIIEVGTPEQQRQHLPHILSGEITWCQGYSESGAGSDLASLKLRAQRDGDVFVVNGHKTWTTNGQHADWMFALARTDVDARPRHAGISMLLIDLRSPGITIRPIQSLSGEYELAEEFFDDVRVPRDNLLGELNGGWKLATRVLGAERLMTGHPRLAARLLNLSRDVARRTGVLDEPTFQAQLAGLEIELLAFSAYFRHGIALLADKRAPVSLAPTIRIVGGELAQRASELLMTAAGPLGTMEDDLTINDRLINIATELFEARRFTVGSGSVEIQRNILARRVLGLPT